MIKGSYSLISPMARVALASLVAATSFCVQLQQSGLVFGLSEAVAKDGNGGNGNGGGGNGNGNGNGGSGNNGNGASGNAGGKGNSKSGENAAGEERASPSTGRTSFKGRANKASVSVQGQNIVVRYSNGIVETVTNGVYVIMDSKGRRIATRQATRSDEKRMRLLAD